MIVKFIMAIIPQEEILDRTIRRKDYRFPEVFISNADIRKIFSLGDKDKYRASHIIKDTIESSANGFAHDFSRAFCSLPVR